MKFDELFNVAKKFDKFGSVVFSLVLAISIALLVFPGPHGEAILHPCLIVLAIAAIVCTVVTTIYQTEGNCALRDSQLSDGLGAGVGEPNREDYYNNALPKSMRRLAATTLENTFFTKEVLSAMATRERIKNAAYFLVLLALMACRWTSTEWLLILSQTLFSADLILQWIRLERFRLRTNRVYARLEQFFLQNADINRPNDIAILLAAFTDYECAKDEAVLPLDSEVFEKLNPRLSTEWEEIKKRLGIK